MTDQTIVHNTFVIARAYPKPVETVFAAFAEPAKKRRWYAQSKDADTYEMDFRVGGIERAHSRMGASTPFPGATLANEGSHLDIVANARIVIASTMALDGRRFSASLATFAFAAAAKGTELVFTHQGAFFEGADGPRMREDGWRALLDRLAAELAH